MIEEEKRRSLEGLGLALPHKIHVASSDTQLKEILLNIKTSKTPAVINYGASCILTNLKAMCRRWAIYLALQLLSVFACHLVCPRCRVCSQILPSFCHLSSKFKKLSFIYADIDECPETTQNIRYTPTFHFYRDGERVDEMFGTGEERLRDRLWLHS